MPEALKVLGQINPSANTATTVYNVPASTSAVVSAVTVCNTLSTSATYRLATRPAAANLTTAHYLAYDVSIAGNDTAVLKLGLTLAATDVLTAYASTGNLVFHAYGSEVT